MPFGKWIHVEETAMPQFNFAQKCNLATASEDIFKGKLTAINSLQGIICFGSQHTDQIIWTRTSSDDICEKLQDSFVTFPSDDAHCSATQDCDSQTTKANTGELKEWSKEENNDYTSKIGQKCCRQDLKRKRS